MRRAPALLVAGIAIVAAWGLVALAAPFLATHDPIAINFEALLQPPGDANYFGTDNTGRDVFSRVVYGTRYALYIGSVSYTHLTLPTSDLV